MLILTNFDVGILRFFFLNYFEKGKNTIKKISSYQALFANSLSVLVLLVVSVVLNYQIHKDK